jgi:hypothetical protein
VTITGLTTTTDLTATGTTTLAGASTSADITFGDNDKAIFGAGSDLQIYHDGAHSYVDENGTGQLKIRSNGTGVLLQTVSGENLATFANNAAVNLYYDNAPKLATTGTGVDITGTLTSDGLTSSGGVSIQNDAASFSISNAAVDRYQRFRRNSSNSLILDKYNGSTTTNTAKFDENGDISFYDSAGSSQSFFWDASAENLGIGTSSPNSYSSQTTLTINGSTYGRLDLESAGTLRASLFATTGSTTLSAATDVLSFDTSGGEAMRIDSSGNVGIGVTPEAWSSLYGTKALQVGAQASLSDINGDLHLSSNAYYDTTNARWEYINADYATKYTQVDGVHQWLTAASGSADAAITWSEAMRIDSSGNVGIGRTPSAFNTSYVGLQIGGTGGNSITLAGNDASIGTGYYLSALGTYAYDNSSATASMLNMYNREFVFKTAASGIAGNTITWSERMRIDSSGNVGIGTDSPDNNSGYTALTMSNTSGTGGGQVYVKASSAVGVFGADNANSGANPKVILQTNTSHPLVFGTSGTEAMRIDSSGNLLVGKPSTDAGVTAGLEYASNVLYSTRAGTPAAFNRLTSDGDIALFRKDGATVGSIGVGGSGDLYIGDGDTALLIDGESDLVAPWNTSTNLVRDNAIDLGYSSGRFKDLYLSGGVFAGATSGGAKVVAEAIATGTTYSASWPATGGTALYMQVNSSAVGSITTTTSATAYNTSSDYRLKTDAQPMTGATDRLKQLNPVNFEWIADGTRVDGFLAHEAQAVVPEAVTGAKDAMRDEEYEVTPAVTDDDGNVVTEAVMGTRSVPDYQGIDQSKLVPLLVATIQELEARITALENA